MYNRAQEDDVMAKRSGEKIREAAKKPGEVDGTATPVKSFDAWKKKACGGRIPKAVEEFLKYRHREWEQ